MIIDRIKNIDLYGNILPEAVDFIKALHLGVALGRHEISGRVYANVEKYLTKSVDSARFEAHREYIDIQLLLSGRERIFYKNIENLKFPEPYDKTRDIMFFSDNIAKSDFIELDGTNFVVIYPHEAHAPQVDADNKSDVIKVVVKIKV